jgi:thymidylate synthase ThyX
MTHRSANIFCLTDSEGRLLSPAVQATVLAKYSRSPLSAQELLAQLTEEEADKFQSKWVVGYGHDSVAELATIPICLEGVSIIASKILESWPRAAYSEKSTRYQIFSKDSFVTPPGAPDTMKQFAGRFYEAYAALNVRMIRKIAELVGDDPENPKTTTKARAFDNVRYLLPAGTGTNVAAAMNLRDVRDMITTLRGHTNSEFKAIGEGVYTAAMRMAPALIKYTEPDTFSLPVKSLGAINSAFSYEHPQPCVNIYNSECISDPQMEMSIFKAAVQDRHTMNWETFNQHMLSRPSHAGVPDIFKTIKISFEIIMDYGAFRDLQRHRRCDQFTEPFRSDYGYVVPEDIVGTDLEPDYRSAMESLSSYQDERVVHDPDWFQYMIPLGYLHRSIFQMDLKELYYITELRTKPQGHISYRRIAYEIYLLAQQRFPELMQWCRVVKPESVGLHT